MNIPSTPRELINWWLDQINETDQACRDEVLNACATDPEVRKYWVGYAKKHWTSYSEANNMDGIFVWGVA